MCISTLSYDTLNVSLSVGFQMNSGQCLHITKLVLFIVGNTIGRNASNGMEEKSRDVKEVCVCES